MHDGGFKANDYQGRGVRPPDVGLLDYAFAIALGYVFYQLLMAWAES